MIMDDLFEDFDIASVIGFMWVYGVMLQLIERYEKNKKRAIKIFSKEENSLARMEWFIKLAIQGFKKTRPQVLFSRKGMGCSAIESVSFNIMLKMFSYLESRGLEFPKNDREMRERLREIKNTLNNLSLGCKGKKIDITSAQWKRFTLFITEFGSNCVTEIDKFECGMRGEQGHLVYYG